MSTNTKAVNMQQNISRLKESLENFDAAKTERIGSPSLGDVVRQGDLYMQCIAKLPSGKKTENRQLAEGNTQGSRHILEGDCAIVTDISLDKYPKELTGPAFHCKSDVEVTHPEHGNKILPAGTTWQCIYQQVHADVVRRVRD